MSEVGTDWRSFRMMTFILRLGHLGGNFNFFHFSALSRFCIQAWSAARKRFCSLLFHSRFPEFCPCGVYAYAYIKLHMHNSRGAKFPFGADFLLSAPGLCPLLLKLSTLPAPARSETAGPRFLRLRVSARGLRAFWESICHATAFFSLFIPMILHAACPWRTCFLFFASLVEYFF